jgi:hypothetical protein
MTAKSIDKITLQGLNSHNEIIIRIDVIVELVKAYMCVIPNEKRDLSMSLKVLRLHDELNKMVAAEEDAADKYIEKKTKDHIMEETQHEGDLPV